MAWFEGFEQRREVVDTDRVGSPVGVHVRIGGRADAPPLVLLHGFPQTGAMWQRVARELAPHFRLVIPDLRGYGDSDKPVGDADHANYSKRRMAADVHTLMRSLGHERYFVAGHDRGGRVAHRLALDEPQAVLRLAVLDIAPTLAMYESTDMRFASAYYHWFFLIQPKPHPEQLIEADALHYLRWKLGGWGSFGHKFYEPEAVAEYERCWQSAGTIHAACEDYRASASIDLDHDRASREAGARIRCELSVLIGTRGVVHALFDAQALWRAASANRLEMQSLAAGHYLAEELPGPTAEHLRRFFQA
jgi:haloacetate dehalogenase